jgi:hypothetical protein
VVLQALAARRVDQPPRALVDIHDQLARDQPVDEGDDAVLAVHAASR